jgi:hypothetical protein
MITTEQRCNAALCNHFLQVGIRNLYADHTSALSDGGSVSIGAKT